MSIIHHQALSELNVQKQQQANLRKALQNQIISAASSMGGGQAAAGLAQNRNLRATARAVTIGNRLTGGAGTGAGRLSLRATGAPPSSMSMDASGSTPSGPSGGPASASGGPSSSSGGSSGSVNSSNAAHRNVHRLNRQSRMSNRQSQRCYSLLSKGSAIGGNRSATDPTQKGDNTISV